MKAICRHLAAFVLFFLLMMSSALVISASAASVNNPAHTFDLIETLRRFNYLEKISSGYMRVCCDGKIYIEYYDSSFNLLSKKSLILELPYWGGFYRSGDTYYVVEGQENQDNVDGTEVVRIIKYDKNWNKLGHASIEAMEGWEYEIGCPFAEGCVEFAEADGKLYVVTGREGYVDPRYGIGHQGMMLIAVDETTMTSEIVYGDFAHSFAQYIQADGNTLFVYEQSESRRATTLSTFDAARRSGIDYADPFFEAKTGLAKVLPYGGTRTSATAIACYASVDGMELSSNNVIGLGTSIDQSKYDDVTDDTPHNLYLTITPKDNVSAEATKVKWLTDFTGGGKCFTNAKITKINDDRFLVSWAVFEEGDDIQSELNDTLSGNKLHYILIDGEGNTVSKEYTAMATASNCDPIAVGNKVVFEASCFNMVNFYTIDTETGKLTKKCYRIAGENATWEITDGKLVISGTGAFKTYNGGFCIHAISSTSGWFSYGSADNDWAPIRDRVNSILIKSGITEIAEGQLRYFKATDIVIEEGVTKIGKEAFAFSDELQDLTIPASVKTIGDDIVWTGSYWLGDNSHVYHATIHTTKDSAAAKYAIKNGIRYVYDFSACKVTIPYSSYTYRGRGIKPTVTVTDPAGNKLVKGIDYKVTYLNNTVPGTATIKVTGLGDYEGTLKKTFTVKPLSLSSSYANITIPYTAYTYTGSGIKPAVTVKFKDGDIIPNSDYTVSYSNNVKVGVATVTVTAKGSNTTGSWKKTFIVKPAKNEITGITTTKGAFKITWKKATEGAVGYQVLYSQDKSALASATGEVVSTDTKKYVHSYTSADLSDLSENFSKYPNSGETWYVKIRSFFTKDGKTTSTRYGNYSAVKSIKIK